jgi:hypothetical protein
MINNMAAPRNILSTLKKRRKTSSLNAKHVYNARYRMKKADRGPRTEMQHLMKCLVELLVQSQSSSRHGYAQRYFMGPSEPREAL